MKGAARLINEASPTPTSLERKRENFKNTYGSYIFTNMYVVNTKTITYMRQNVMDQKSKERPQHKVARVQTDNPTPISLKGFTLQNIGIM
jgi:hypothetical protein